MTLGLPGSPYRVRLAERQDDDLGPEIARVSLRLGGHDLLLRCPMALLRDAMVALEPGLHPGPPAPDLAALLIEAAAVDAIDAIEAAFGLEFHVVRCEPEAEAGCEAGAGVVLALHDGARDWPMWLGDADRPSEGVRTLLSRWPEEPRALPRLGFAAALRLGTTRLSIGELRSLRRDDAVLMQNGYDAGHMLVVAESLVARTEVSDGQCVLVEPTRWARVNPDLEWTMRDQAEDETSTDHLDDLEDLPVQVVFDVGRLDLSLAELRRLGPGSVIGTDRSIGEPVRISANGRSFGQGEIVDVDGRVGVRILRIFNHG